MTPIIRLVPLLAALTFVNLTARAADDGDGTRRFYGYGYDLKSGQYRYTEVYEQVYANGRWKSGRIRDYSPDGHLIADKTLDFSANPYVPIVHFEIFGEHYVDAITAVTKTQATVHKQSDGKSSDKSVDVDETTAGDSGFHCYLVEHFDALMQHQTVAFKLIVAGEQDRFKFRAHRIDDTQFQNKTAVRFLIEPDSLLRYLIDPLTLTYDPDSKKLLEYRGISNLHDAATGKAYNVRVTYPDQPPADAPKTLPALTGD